MEKRYPIGTFAKMTNITPRTLHYYDEIGLLQAKRTEAGHRYYTKEDLITLQRIVSLKFLGYSLETIKELLAKETWNTAEYFTFQHQEMLKKKRQLEHAIRLLEHAQNLINERGELDPDVFFLLINSVQMEEEHKKWLKTFVPEHLVEQLYAISDEKQREIEQKFITLVNQLKETNLDDPENEQVQQRIAELFHFTRQVIGDELLNHFTNLDPIELSDEEEWLFPALLFTPEEEKKLAKAIDIYLQKEGDTFGKED